MKPGLVLILASGACLAGPFSPPAGQGGSDAIHRASTAFSFWANGISLDRGPIDIAFPGGASASFGSATDALGPADADADLLETFPVVSLGDGGSATLAPGDTMSVPENLAHSAVPSMTGEASLYHIVATGDPAGLTWQG